MSTENPFNSATKAPRGPSPFADIPLSDYLRDAAALTLLLVSFAMHWNFQSMVTGRVEVILITLLSVFSLSITYLARAGVFPSSVTVARVWLLRLVANLPYAALVLTYLVIDIAAGSNYTSGGVGLAAAFGLTGAILAAQPREAEVRMLARGASVGELWYRIVVVFGAVAVLSAVVALILLLIRPGMAFAPVVSIVVLIASVVLNLIGITLAYLGVILRSEVGRLVAFAVGASILGVILIDLFSGFRISGGGVDSIHAVGYGAIFLAALAGLTASPPLRLAMRPIDDLHRWLRAASVLLLVVVGVAAFTVFLTILALSALGSSYTGFGIGTLVTVVIMALVAVVARTVLRNDPANNRPLVLSLVGLLLLLGIVHVVLAAVGAQVGVIDLFLAFGLPLSIAVCLSIPPAVREYYRRESAASEGPSRTASFVEQLTGPVTPVPASMPGATAAEPAATAPAAAAAPPSSAKVAQALDPATSPAVLFQLAQDEPGLRPYLAANPSTYPDLLAWLGQLGDPAVDAALKARG